MEQDHMHPISSNGGAEESPNFPADLTHAAYGDHPLEAAAATTGAAPASHDGAGNIDKIRDIIFGSNMRDYDQRFARLEESLKKESHDIRDATRRHLEALEAFVHKELAALEGRLNTEREERAHGHARLAQELSEQANSLSRKIGEVENQEAQAKREIRNDLLQQSKDLSDAIRTKSEELAAMLERRAQELQHSKTDRAALAGLFSEVSMRLADQFKTSGAD